MHYYREVMTDDPFRRSEREDPSGTADDTGKGDLFGLRRPAGNSSTSCRPARPRDRRNWSAVARRRLVSKPHVPVQLYLVQVAELLMDDEGGGGQRRKTLVLPLLNQSGRAG
jgi:hypothetical protein